MQGAQSLTPVRELWGEGNGTTLQYSCLENPMDGRSEGEKGLRWSGAGTLGGPLEWDRYVTALLRSHQGCQVQFRTSRRNVGILWRCSSGQGPHIAMTRETRGFSRVAARFSWYDWVTNTSTHSWQKVKQFMSHIFLSPTKRIRKIYSIYKFKNWIKPL